MSYPIHIKCYVEIDKIVGNKVIECYNEFEKRNEAVSEAIELFETEENEDLNWNSKIYGKLLKYLSNYKPWNLLKIRLHIAKKDWVNFETWLKEFGLFDEYDSEDEYRCYLIEQEIAKEIQKNENYILAKNCPCQCLCE